MVMTTSPLWQTTGTQRCCQCSFRWGAWRSAMQLAWQLAPHSHTALVTMVRLHAAQGVRMLHCESTGLLAALRCCSLCMRAARIRYWAGWSRLSYEDCFCEPLKPPVGFGSALLKVIAGNGCCVDSVAVPQNSNFIMLLCMYAVCRNPRCLCHVPAGSLP